MIDDIKYISVYSLRSESVSFVRYSTSPMEKIGKGFCLHMVHTGTNKIISQVAIIENYNAGFVGMETY